MNEQESKEKLPMAFVDEDKLFDSLISSSDPSKFLSDAYTQGKEGKFFLREQALGYMQLLMEEEGFLNNLSPRELFSVAVSNPEFVEDSINRIASAGEADGEFRMTGTLEKLLNALPTSIDTAIQTYTVEAMAGVVRLYGALLGPGPAGTYSLARRIVALRSWSAAAAQRSFLGGLLRPSPLRREDAPAAPAAGTTIAEAMRETAEAMRRRQAVWEAAQGGLAQLVHALLRSPLAADVGAALAALVGAARLRATEAGRMQLLGRAVMQDPFALNLLDLMLRLQALAWEAAPAARAAALDAAWPACFAAAGWATDPLALDTPPAPAQGAAAGDGAAMADEGEGPGPGAGRGGAGAGGGGPAVGGGAAVGGGGGAGAGDVGGTGLFVETLMCLEGADLMQAGAFREMQRLYAQVRQGAAPVRRCGLGAQVGGAARRGRL
jgi:hypothetical protein